MIAIHVARQAVLDSCSVLTAELTSYEDMVGRVVAQDVVATENVPPFANSAMDGYAVRAVDVAVVPCELRVIGTIAAGAASSLTLGAGEAFSIMTGAPIPSGVDAVVMVEDSETLGNDRVRLKRVARHMQAIREVGSDVQIGDVVFGVGSVLNAPGIGVLASINARHVMAYPRARVAVLSTGDELVTDGSPLQPGQIRESNLTMLVAMIAATGCDVINLGIVADDEESLEKSLHDVSSRCDAIVTSGGVSMGNFDIVKAVLSRIAQMNWMQLAMKPAKPFALGQLATTDGRTIPIFGLPGNPVSSLVSYELLARPALRKMMGHTRELLRPSVKAIVDAPLKRKTDGKIHYIRVFGSFAPDGRLHVRDTGPQESHQLAATALANGLAAVPDGDGVDIGDEVDVMLWA